MIPLLAVLLWLLIVAPALRSRLPNEIYAHCGLAILVTLPLFTISDVSTPLNIKWLKYCGIALFVPTMGITAAAVYQLNWRVWCEAFWPDRPESDDFITDGIYCFVRHPTFLAAALWTFIAASAMQSAVTLSLAAVAIGLFRIASSAEDSLNIRKFGKEYNNYAARVPAWNIVAGLLRRCPL